MSSQGLFGDSNVTSSGIRITGLAGVVEQAKSLCQAAVGGVGADFVSPHETAKISRIMDMQHHWVFFVLAVPHR